LLVSQTDTVLRIPVDVTVTNHNRARKSCECFVKYIVACNLFRWAAVDVCKYIQLNTAVYYRMYTCASFITGPFRNGFLPHKLTRRFHVSGNIVVTVR